MNSRGNKVLTISSVDQLIRWWGFFREGLEYFQKELKWDKTNDDYFKMLLHIVHVGESYGIVLVSVSQSGQPYGYVVVVDATAPFSKRTCNVYAIYSNHKCPSTITELAAEAEQWAKSHNFQEVQACSYRVSGGMMKWFERKMKFQRKFMVFCKKL